MDSANSFAPLVGLSLGLWFAFLALAVFALLLWILVPFILIAIRRLDERQLETLLRIEKLLAEAPATPAGAPRSPPPNALPPPLG